MPRRTQAGCKKGDEIYKISNNEYNFPNVRPVGVANGPAGPAIGL